MTRTTTITAAALMTAALAMAPEAEGQWAYRPYGWGGWGGGTVGGDVARGMGVFAAGAGQYNQQTAVANSINTDNRMRLNEYLWQSEQVRKQQYYEKVARQNANRKEAASEIQARQLYKPERNDVVKGDALNAILHQLRSPGVPDSILVNSSTDLTLTGEQIKLIPLKFASKGVVISAHRLAADDAWPLPLQAAAFKDLRMQYQQLVEGVRNLPDEAEVPDETLVQGINLIERMRDEAKADLKGPEYAEAERFLKTHAGLLQMARQPQIRQVLEEAYKKPEVTLGNALLGMDAFNLEFGAADDPKEEAFYVSELYPKLAELRGRVAQELGGKIPDDFQASVGAAPPVGAFDKLPWEQLGRDQAAGESPPAGDPAPAGR